MKRLYFLLFAICLINVTNAQWITLNSGTTASLISVDFVNTDTGYAVGYNGTIIKTTDGGTTWTELISGTTIALTSVHFPSTDTGYVVGSNSAGVIILKTTDDGADWTTQYSFENISSLQSVYFPNTNTGYIVGSESNDTTGSSGIILKTIDGGANWTMQSYYQYSLNSVYFKTEDIGYVVGFKNNDTLGTSGVILKTTDGGTTWTEKNFGGNNNYYFYSVYFSTVNTGYVVGSKSIDTSGMAGIILKTTDGGENWTTQSFGTLTNFFSVTFPTTDTGYAAGADEAGGFFLKTTNGGADWIADSSAIANTSGSIFSAFFTDANTGYIINSNGMILKNKYIYANISAAPDVICRGDSTQLSVRPSDSTSLYKYSWSSNPVGFSSSLANPIVTPPSNTTYTVTLTDKNNFHDIEHLIVSVYNCSPLINNDTVKIKVTNGEILFDSVSLKTLDSCFFDYTQPLDTFYIKDMSLQGKMVNFNWVFIQGNKTINVSSSIDIDSLKSGNYLLYLTIQCSNKKKGFNTNTFAAPFNIISLNLNEKDKQPFSMILYPNPTKDKFTISFDHSKKDYTLEILNTIGQVVLNKKITNNIELIDLTGQPAGVYFVKLQSENNTVIRKIIKQ